MADEPETVLTDDPGPIRKIRYVFTVVTPVMELSSNPLIEKVWLAEYIGKLEETVKPGRIGVVAVFED